VIQRSKTFPPRDWPESDPTRGREAVWDLYVKNNEIWGEGAIKPVELIEAGDDKVVAHAQGEMQGQASGAAVAWSYWQVVTFRDGRALRIEWFADRAEALAAVGLRASAGGAILGGRCRRRTSRRSGGTTRR